jgi:hypothetical protein
MTPIAAEASDHVRVTILVRLARFDSAIPLVGTTQSLARVFGVTVTEFLSALRDLLETNRIVVEMELQDRLSVRLNDRYTAPADRPM